MRRGRGRWRSLLRLPEDRASRTLVLAIITSVVFHLLLLGPFFIYGKWLLPDMYQKRGEPLLVDITPDKPEERAPLGNPSRPVGPPESQARPAPPPSPPTPRIPPAPRVAAARPTPPAPPAPRAPAAPPAPAKAEPPSPDALVKTPEPKPAAPAPTPEQQQPAQSEQEQHSASVSAPPQTASRIPPGMMRQGGGGGLRGGGHGGVEGEPIPLDSPDPRFQDYLRQVRDRIKAKWVYPREAGDRGIEGELLIEFHIAKDGHLEAIELRQTSGTDILDFAAMNAIKLASPYPPVPDSMSKQTLAINGQFRYQIVSGLVNQFLR